ncbi:FAD-dependent oxidoreductase [Natronoglycomyces albus]|uniref:FAD-dependent oxidoreductase n=1 Tax=Natronoglycomyces albus TaxID=2811108 RepID=A0A895XU32_9ACTN|nr:FAD-dependent oxidoreductase [Natronoglycomyces albus]QSB05158.1 FAD-dependent oxidoreductase [Natronoglycomyces albus]
MNTDLVVIGAGPAGLACAVTAAEQGATVVLIDSGPRPGGQFWRHGNQYTTSAQGQGHHNWKTFLDLKRRLDQAIDNGAIRYLPRTHVWMLENNGDFITRTTTENPPEPNAHTAIRSRQLALCTGAYDRQLPVPGWDLPGVMAAGGVQAFIKTNGFSPGTRAVVAGTGPFLLSVAASIVHTGATVAAICEANPPTKWLPRLHRAASVPSKAMEAIEYAATLARRRIPYRTRTMITRIIGQDRVEAVETTRLDRAGRVIVGARREIPCDLVALGWGFTPQLELPLALGVETRVDDDGSLVCRADDQGRTSVPGLVVAGESTGVGGAALAVAEGHAAAHAVTESPVPKRITRTAKRLRGFAQAMHQAHPIPTGWQTPLTPDTVVCRCEEVTVDEITTAATDMAATDPRSAKSFTRAGMGWCQGRECGFALTCMNSHDPMRGDAEELRAIHKRPLATPIPLSALSNMTTPPATPPRKDNA